MAINLVAADYNAATGAWDNRATTGGFSNTTNGDFAAVPSIALPYRVPAKTTINGITGVLFNGGRLQTANGAASIANPSIWGGSDWTVEAWVMMNGTEIANEVPVIQWGQRSGPTSGVCNSAYLAVGEYFLLPPSQRDRLSSIRP